MTSPLRRTALPVGVLVSGSGTNLQAIIDQQESGNLPIDIKIVLSNAQTAFALERAKRHGIEVEYVPHHAFDSREAFDAELTRILEVYGVELVVLAGYMKLLSSSFVEHWKNRSINVHPSLLPAFPGLYAQRQALKYGVKVTGCSVFFVDEGVDTGPIIIQATVPVSSNDTEATLSARILKKEHLILPKAIGWIAGDSLKVEGRRVITPILQDN
jgi:phosphoribosylglycinamide formyltransferase-1